MTVGIAPKLIDRATVYTANPSTGIFDVVVATALPCRLMHPTTEGAGTARAELLAKRRLIWQGYVMPSNCQIEISGHRWNFDGGDQSIGTYRDFPGVERYRGVDVVRAD